MHFDDVWVVQAKDHLQLLLKCLVVNLSLLIMSMLALQRAIMTCDGLIKAFYPVSRNALNCKFLIRIISQ